MARRARIKNAQGDVTVLGFHITANGTKVVHFMADDGRTYFIDPDLIEIIPDEVDPEDVNRLKHIELQYERLLNTCSMFREQAKHKADLTSNEIDYSYYQGMRSGIWKVMEQIKTIMKGDSDDERHQKN